MRKSNILFNIYKRLLRVFGPQHWWPGDSAFEVMVGAILTQNTNWSNVERAINNLKIARVLTPLAIQQMPQKRLAARIQPAGYFNIKAKRLKNFVGFYIEKFAANVENMKRMPSDNLRQQLLAVNGIGPETADSILLYACQMPFFVVDAYTKRIFSRHGIVSANADYHQVQEQFMSALKKDVALFNEYHALIVRLGKDFCRTKARCAACPLNQKRFFPRRD